MDKLIVVKCLKGHERKDWHDGVGMYQRVTYCGRCGKVSLFTATDDNETKPKER